MKKSFKILGFLFSVLLTALFFYCPEPSLAAGGASLAFAFGAGWIDSSGTYLLPNGRAASSDPGAVQAAQALITGASQCQSEGNYRFPDKFTLTASTVGGAAGTFKFTQADDMTEAIQGSIGDQWFSVLELPNGGGTVPRQDGTDIFGAQSLARMLQTYGLKIGKIQASGSAIANTTSLIMQAYRSDLKGVRGEQWKLEVDTTNAQSAAMTFVLVKDIDLTSNVSFNCPMPDETTLQLTFYVVGIIPYI